MSDIITLPRVVALHFREALICGKGRSPHRCHDCDFHLDEAALDALDAALAEPDEEIARLEDRIDWLENGLAEWRDMALSNARQAKAVRATARIAIRHLKAVLAECAYDPVRADMEAQDWLVSIGDDVEEKK